MKPHIINLVVQVQALTETYSGSGRYTWKVFVDAYELPYRVYGANEDEALARAVETVHARATGRDDD